MTTEKKRNIVIFGAGEIAQLAHYYFTHDSAYDVSAFTVDKDFRQGDTYCDLPLVDFESVEKQYPPSQYGMFVALSYRGLNSLRADKVKDARAKGYDLVSYISSHATVFPNVTIGDNCFLLEDNTVQPFVTIGENVTLWSGNHIGHHAKIGNHCFITSHVVISGGVTVGDYAFIGVNATLRDHITVAPKTLIGAGALVLFDTQEKEVYVGQKSKPAPMTSDQVKNI